MGEGAAMKSIADEKHLGRQRWTIIDWQNAFKYTAVAYKLHCTHKTNIQCFIVLFRKS